MASEWATLPLGDLCLKITDGAHSSPPSVQLGKRMASVKDLTRFGVELKDARHISESDFELLVKQGCQPQVGDVLIAKDGNSALDTTCLVKKPLDAVLLSSVAILRPNPDKLIPEFLKQHLSSQRTIDYLKSEFISGAAIPRVILKDFKRAIINVPPIEEQRAIAHILGTLDDKIELNRQQNETLEAMARALFKDWFVDFGPVRAKMEGREPYFSADLWQLFPDRLDDEGKPAEWEMRTVSECFSLTMGQSPPGDTYNDIGDGLPFFQGRTDFGFRYPKNRKYCSAPTRIANAEDTLVSVRAPVGDINLAWEKCCVGRGVAAIRHLSGARSFTYHATWSLQDELKQYEHTGTVFGAINKNQFEAMELIEPSRALIDAYEHRIGPFDDKVRNNIAESRTLAQLRDTLLPKLISGELRIKNAEKFMESNDL